MRGLIITGSLLLVVPLVLLWYTRRKRGSVRDLMDEQPCVRKKRETLFGEMEILKSDIRFVIGMKGCVVRDIESRCNVRIIFNTEEKKEEDEEKKEEDKQIIKIRGFSLEEIEDAKELIKEACERKPKILKEIINIRSEFCGKIIGKGGDNLRDIIEKSGTRILISRDGEGEYRHCEIEGTQEEIDYAKSLIDSNIEFEMEIREKRWQRNVIKEYTNYKKEQPKNIAAKILESETMGLKMEDKLKMEDIKTEDNIANTENVLRMELKMRDGVIIEDVVRIKDVIPTDDGVETVNVVNTEDMLLMTEDDVRMELKMEDEVGIEDVAMTEDVLEAEDLAETEDVVEAEDELDEVELPVIVTGAVSEVAKEACPITSSHSRNSSLERTLTESFETHDMEPCEMPTQKILELVTAATQGTMLESTSNNDALLSYQSSITSFSTDEFTPHLDNLSGGEVDDILLEEKVEDGLSQKGVSEEEMNFSISVDMTADLKNLLGISDCSLKTKEIPLNVEIMNILNNAVSDAVEHAESCYKCDFVDCVESFPDLPSHAKISYIPCCSHVWVQRADNKGMASALEQYLDILASADLDRTTNVMENAKYLFHNGTGQCVRVNVIKMLPNHLVDCYDIDTGSPFTTTLTSLCYLPETVTLDKFPPLAQCVCTGDTCVKVNDTPSGSLVTVTTMGQHKDVRYPRVKLHDVNGEQIIYLGDTRYTESYQIGHVSLPPGSSSLVYVSAIHNAGHFYVQVCGKNISELDRLESLMASDYGAETERPTTDWDAVPGDLCGVWHTAEKMWLRGQVMELDSSDMLYVKYLDYGDTVHVSHCYVRKLKLKFTMLPYQAIECFLANTVPITTRQWTPDATAKFDVLTQCGQWYPLRCIVVGEHRGKPCVELYDQPYSDKEYSVGESLCAMHYARSSKLEKPPVKTLTTPIPSFASGAAYLVSPDFEDVDDELEQLFSVDDDSDSADSDDFPVSRVNVSRLLMSLTQQNQQSWPSSKASSKYRPTPCEEPKNAFMEPSGQEEGQGSSDEQSTPKPARKMTGVKRKNKREDFKSQISSSSSESEVLSEAAHYSTPLCTSPRSTISNSSYASTADFVTPGGDFNNTFTHTSYTLNLATPLHLSSAEDTDCG